MVNTYRPIVPTNIWHKCDVTVTLFRHRRHCFNILTMKFLHRACGSLGGGAHFAQAIFVWESAVLRNMSIAMHICVSVRQHVHFFSVASDADFDYIYSIVLERWLKQIIVIAAVTLCSNRFDAAHKMEVLSAWRQAVVAMTTCLLLHACYINASELTICCAFFFCVLALWTRHHLSHLSHFPNRVTA